MSLILSVAPRLSALAMRLLPLSATLLLPGPGVGALAGQLGSAVRAQVRAWLLIGSRLRTSCQVRMRLVVTCMPVQMP